MSDKWAWAVKELLTPGPDARRLRLGLLGRTELAAPPFRSKLVLAPTGSGKTPRVIVPDVLLHEGPAVVASVKDDTLHLTYHARQQAGLVWIFDPSGATGLPTCRWSPLTGLDTYAAAYSGARWLCESSNVEKRGLENQQVWDTMGRWMLPAMLYAAAASDLAMTEVVHWVPDHRRGRGPAAAGRSRRPIRHHAWQSRIDTVDRTKSSVYGTAWEILESWGHPDCVQEPWLPVWHQTTCFDSCFDGRSVMLSCFVSGRRCSGSGRTANQCRTGRWVAGRPAGGRCAQSGQPPRTSQRP